MTSFISKVEGEAVMTVLEDTKFLWWRHFRNRFPRFRDSFIDGDDSGLVFYSDVFSIIAEEMSKDDTDRNHE